MSLFSVTETGLITVDSSGIKDAFIQAYQGALGSGIRTDAGTFQGQMILNDTSMLTYAQNQCVLIANAYSVLRAKGSALDVVANFWGYYRRQATATVVNCLMSGDEGLIIPKGSLVSDGTHKYELLDDAEISASGSVIGQFQCTEKGAIVCLGGEITEIVSTLEGWDTVVNNASGVTGYDVENDNQFRARITANWFNVRARGSLGAIWDNIAQLENVASVCVRENPANVEIDIDGYVLNEHSVFVCVAGGSESDIAECLYNQKTIGADTNGDTLVSWYDSTTGLTNSYRIQRAETVNLKVDVNYQTSYFTTADVEEQIKTAILGWVSENPFRIGQTISGNMLAQAFDGFVYANLLSIKVGVVGSEDDPEDYLTTTIGQIAVLEGANITCTEVE